MTEPTIEAIAPDDGPLFELYHENSKLRRWDADFGLRVAAFTESKQLMQLVSATAKTYHGAPAIPLPSANLEGIDFKSALLRRRSAFHMTRGSLQSNEWSDLLFACAGIVSTTRGDRRVAPSAGAMYPLETYLILNQGEIAEPGVYHYDSRRHKLAAISIGLEWAQVADRTSYPALVQQASGMIVIAARFARSAAKYGERAYRFCLLEAGHAMQNVLLTATGLDLAAVPLGGFYDDELNALIGLDGVEEGAIYPVVIGRPNRTDPPEEG